MGWTAEIQAVYACLQKSLAGFKNETKGEHIQNNTIPLYKTGN